ncbi:hypothetical protein [Sulfolobus acidocaldarius]|uniref:hypothetical protein n=1 Tax=Sulfolobus acidocaldarius TaxID=2285 RepID=UPI000783529B
MLALLKVAKEENAEVTATKLQKIFFLLEKEGGVDLGLGFEPFYFGPYSEYLQNKINKLIDAGIVSVEEDPVEDMITGFVVGVRRKYVLAKDMEIKGVDKKVLDFFREWVRKSRSEILKYVYYRYPEYTSYSIIRDKILRGK